MKKVLLACATMLVGVMLCGCGETKISLNDYITYEVTGVDGYGTVDTSISQAKLTEIIETVAGESIEDPWNYTDSWVVRNINGSWNEVSNLSNGDKITYTWNVDEEILKDKYDIVFDCEDIVYEVEGLKEVSEFDPFEYVVVDFYGAAPSGCVSVERTSDAPYNYVFTADKESRLSNGDEVTVTFSINGADDITEYCAQNLEAVPSQISKVYTVEGLSSYVENIADIPQEGMDDMIAQAEDEVYSQNLTDGEELINVENAGCILLKAKDTSLNDEHNFLYVVEKVTVSNSEVVGELDYYFTIKYQDVKIKEDGTLDVDLYNPEIPYGGMSFIGIYGNTFKTGKYYYLGYSNYDALYKSCVTEVRADYTAESTVEEDESFRYYEDVLNAN